MQEYPGESGIVSSRRVKSRNMYLREVFVEG